MLFSSNIFLFLFFIAVLIGYYLLHQRFRNGFLMIMSLIFYAWGEPKFVLVMMGSMVFNYLMALLVHAAGERRRLRRSWLIFSVAGNLSLLFIYKYLDFAITTLNRFGLSLPLQKLLLPIGISFFTFQAMSYVIDVYRGIVPVQKKPQNIGLYISFFPQMIAGPIVRYETIAEQLENRRESFEQFTEGVHRFLIGFGKKVIIANNVALIADAAFALPDAQRTVAYAWLGAVAYAFQILFDFSGYSDMAIGLGLMFGFRFLENFDYPYISRSISEFWRRWHISLGQWFRDYVYFPLGGSRVKTKQRLVLNLLAVWFLTGVWHGASWNFIVWGLFYFALIAFEKLSGWPGKLSSPVGRSAYRVFTLLAVLGGWVLFRAVDLRDAVGYGMSLFGLRGNALIGAQVWYALREYGVVLVLAALCSTPVFKLLSRRINERAVAPVRAAAHAAAYGFYIVMFLWAVSYIVMGAHNPFIYFNF